MDVWVANSVVGTMKVYAWIGPMNWPKPGGGAPAGQLLGKSAEMPRSTGVVLVGLVRHVSSGSEVVQFGHSSADGMYSIWVFTGSGVAA